ncbi:MAG: Twin-arginine translocation pathway signal sequence domain-containing protein [Betaproteobacteria bacterium RIFCSPLOWO2_02_FULL_67_26]|nr:MAG: Twin-arginine translocation pathway signal sequence domain-containing protein [Betaproteobacteria bacterium RIFCSPLOWO2_02_FULL_67_26]
MNRRDFLSTVGAATVASIVPASALAQRSPAGYANLLVLVELKGGNDGLNTVVPYSDSEYYALRPRLAVPRDQVLQLDGRAGLHPSLEPLMALWTRRELAVVQSVGYPGANLSHFRSIEIWDTASNSNEYLGEGWLARTFAAAPAPRSFAADGVVVGGAEMGPFAGAGTRAIALTDTQQFLRQARLAAPAGVARNGALSHILRVEQDIVQAAANLNGNHAFATEFPRTPFGNAVRTASQVIASKAGVAAVKISLNGFDTHSNQPGTHARLLKDLAEGLAALRSALAEAGRWESTLIMTYAEFGRRPRENRSSGTDHGTASTHFLLGGRVKGGLYGPPPGLSRLDGNGNLPFAVDFRDVYATVIERWWGVESARALKGRFASLDIVRA